MEYLEVLKNLIDVVYGSIWLKIKAVRVSDLLEVRTGFRQYDPSAMVLFILVDFDE